MNYKCFLCNLTYTEVNVAIKHLRKDHLVKEKVDEIKCLVFKKQRCGKSFQTFSGLRKHLKTCVNKTCENLCSENISKNESLDCDLHESNEQNAEIVNSDILFSCNEENVLHNPQNDQTSFIFCSNTEDNYEKANAFLKSLVSEVHSYGLKYKTVDCLFKLFGKLVREVSNINISLIQSGDGVNALEVIDSTSDFLCNKIRDHDSKYKRQQKNEADCFYVKPEERAVGAHYEMKRERGSNLALPKLVQSKFQYVPITETLKSLFKCDDFRKLYFDYNSANEEHGKHKCNAGTYVDFCCGNVYKNVELFQSHPNSLQIQIYTDDFEICSPLKTKANVHKVCAVYFNIRNLPSEFLHRMKNIYLVCLLNANDLKTSETDFNNVWEVIIRDLSNLETNGLQIDAQTNLKGKTRRDIKYISVAKLRSSIFSFISKVLQFL